MLFCFKAEQIQAKLNRMEKPQKYKMMQQHPAMIKSAVVMIILKDILIIVAGIMSNENSGLVAILLWDIFFCYHMLQKKEWARKWTIGRSIFGIIFANRFSWGTLKDNVSSPS